MNVALATEPERDRLALVCGWTYRDAIIWLATYDDCGWVLDEQTNISGAAEFVCAAFDLPTGDVKADVRRQMEAMGYDFDGDDDNPATDLGAVLVADDAGGGP